MSSCKRDYFKKKRKLTTLCIFFSALSCKRPPRYNPAESLRSRAPWERFASGLQQAIVSAFLRDGFGGQLQHLLSVCSHSPLTSLQPPPPPPQKKKKKKKHPCTLAPFHYLLLSSPIFPLTHPSGNTVAGRAQWTATQKRKKKATRNNRPCLLHLAQQPCRHKIPSSITVIKGETYIAAQALVSKADEIRSEAASRAGHPAGPLLFSVPVSAWDLHSVLPQKVSWVFAGSFLMLILTLATE